MALSGTPTTPVAGEAGGTPFLERAGLSLFTRPPPPAARALAVGSADDVLEIVVSVIVGDLLVRLDAAQSAYEDPPAIRVCFRIWVA